MKRESSECSELEVVLCRCVCDFGEGGVGGPQSEVLSFAPDPVAEHAAHLPQLIMEKV